LRDLGQASQRSLRSSQHISFLRLLHISNIKEKLFCSKFEKVEIYDSDIKAYLGNTHLQVHHVFQMISLTAPAADVYKDKAHMSFRDVKKIARKAR